MESSATKSWKEYFDALEDEQRIFRIEAEDYVERLKKTISLSPGWRVLDFGCGFGHVARTLAPDVMEIVIWDEAESMRARARLNVADRRNVRWLDDWDQFKVRRDFCFDLVLVNSVVQYMPQEDFSEWLLRWKEVVAREGLIVVSDLLPKTARPVIDMASLIPFSARKGFLRHAIFQGCQELLRYSRARKALRLTRVDHDDLQRLAAHSGLRLRLAPKNLTYRQQRITAIFSKR